MKVELTHVEVAALHAIAAEIDGNLEASRSDEDLRVVLHRAIMRSAKLPEVGWRSSWRTKDEIARAKAERYAAHRAADRRDAAERATSAAARKRLRNGGP